LRYLARDTAMTAGFRSVPETRFDCEAALSPVHSGASRADRRALRTITIAMIRRLMQAQ